jgi:hypothetical protein
MMHRKEMTARRMKGLRIPSTCSSNGCFPSTPFSAIEHWALSVRRFFGSPTSSTMFWLTGADAIPQDFATFGISPE